MFTFAKIDAHRFVLSTFGAVALTAACIGGVAAPARAGTVAAPTSIEGWQQAVERKLDTQGDRFALAMPSGRSAEAVVAVSFTAAGDYAGAAIARSSGNAALDAHALQVASRVAYPALPEGWRGRPQTVAMRLVFGRADTMQQLAAMQRGMDRDVRVAARDRGSDQVAAR